RARSRDRRIDRREVRRDRRELRRDRRELRRDRRRSFYGGDRSVLEQRFRQQRAELRLRQRGDRDFFRESRGRGRH
ncbi:MAG TPA: hypothetical protein VNZ44_16735, partial [Pyrinomonadaceae bacterium]|nr:hypothetical protein [Pyrinomonadaceae bacterium]